MGMYSAIVSRTKRVYLIANHQEQIRLCSILDNHVITCQQSRVRGILRRARGPLLRRAGLGHPPAARRNPLEVLGEHKTRAETERLSRSGYRIREPSASDLGARPPQPLRHPSTDRTKHWRKPDGSTRPARSGGQSGGHTRRTRAVICNPVMPIVACTQNIAGAVASGCSLERRVYRSRT